MPLNKLHIKQIDGLQTQLTQSLTTVLNVGNTASQNILMGTYSIGFGTITPSTNLHVVGGFRYVDGAQTSGYILTTDGNGLASWTASSNVFSAGTVSVLNDLSDVTLDFTLGSTASSDDGKMIHYDATAAQWITDDSVNHGTVVINTKKSTAGTITKGTPVYLIGFDNDIHTVEIANATSSSTMPVIGLAGETLNSTTPKHVISFGKIQGIDTTSGGALANGESWSVNDDLFVDVIAGELTNVRPTGAATQIQRVAKVLRVHATGGQLFIFNTARTAGLPNLTQDTFWMGNSSNQPVETGFNFTNLTDVSITGVSTNDTLRYDGSNWVNNSNLTIDSSGNVVVQGDLTINGTTSTINTKNLLVEDPLILLASTQSGAPTLDAGLMINRGSSATQSLLWDESADTFAFISTNDSHETQGNVSILGYSPLKIGGFTLTDGTEASGYILTTDATGLSSWTSSSALGLGDGIYDGSGTIPTTTVATITDTINFTGGDFGIGATPDAKLHVLGNGTGTASTFLVEDSAGSAFFQIIDNGAWSLGENTTPNASTNVIIGNNSTLDHASSIIIGNSFTEPASTSREGIYIGNNITRTDNSFGYPIAIGRYSEVVDTGIAIGSGNSAGLGAISAGGIAIGTGAQGGGGVAIGNGAGATGSLAVAIGGGAGGGGGFRTVSIGNGASATTQYSIAIGNISSTTGVVQGITLGYNTNNANGAVSIGASNTISSSGYILGNGVTLNGANGITIGEAAVVSATDAIAIGHDAEATALESIAIGGGVVSSAAGAIAMGRSVTPTTTDMTNSTANSVGFGWEETTPSVLFAKTADSYLNGAGNFGVGTASPTAKLTVDGDFRLFDGSQASGYILTSDSVGVASWTSPSSLSGLGTVNKETDTTSFTGGVTSSITHNLNTEDLIIQCYDSTGIQVIPGTIDITGTGSVDVFFSTTLSNVKTIIMG